MIPGLYDIFQERWVNGTVWIVSDTHFGDEELRAGVEGRPADLDIWKNIKSKVGKKDTLIHLGDVGDPFWIERIKGYKILIMGNHDLGKSNYTNIFDEVYEGPLFIGEKIVLSHEPLEIPFAYNLHGHVHDKNAKTDNLHFNACLDVTDYNPINFNQLMKSGPTAKIESKHRQIINKATKRKEEKSKP